MLWTYLCETLHPPVRLVLISWTQTSFHPLKPSLLAYLLNLSKDAVIAFQTVMEVYSLLLLVYMSRDCPTTLMWGQRPCPRCLVHGDPGCLRSHFGGAGHGLQDWELATSLQVFTSYLWTVMVVGETCDRLYEATSADIIIVIFLQKEMVSCFGDIPYALDFSDGEGAPYVGDTIELTVALEDVPHNTELF